MSLSLERRMGMLYTHDPMRGWKRRTSWKMETVEEVVQGSGHLSLPASRLPA